MSKAAACRGRWSSPSPLDILGSHGILTAYAYVVSNNRGSELGVLGAGAAVALLVDPLSFIAVIGVFALIVFHLVVGWRLYRGSASLASGPPPVRLLNLSLPGRVDHDSDMEPIPPELFLDGYPPTIQAIGARLRAIVVAAAPDAIERVRVGWRLIGYDVPVGKRTRYFAFVAPELEHVHLGFEYGVWMSDPDSLLQGAHLDLRKVRYVTYRPGEPIPEALLVEYTEEAARLATIPRGALPAPRHAEG